MGIYNPPVVLPMTPHEMARGRNICLLGTFAPVQDAYGNQGQQGAYFYASKCYIVPEWEELRSERKTITGEIRALWEYRRGFNLEFPFFDGFNQYEDEIHPGLKEFVTIIGSPNLQLQYYGTDENKEYGFMEADTYPYSDPDIKLFESVKVVLRESPKVKYLDNLSTKKIIELTLWEKYYTDIEE